MFLFYLLVGLLAVAAAAIVVLLRRLRDAEEATQRLEAGVGGPATVVRVDTLAEFGGSTARKDEFDPTGTMIYRSSQGGTPAAAKKPEDGAPVVSAIAGRLVCVSGGQKGASFPVVANGMTIGRSPHCDIVLADPRVSSRHAWIGEVDGRTVLRDLKSTNGTFLNAQSRSPIIEVTLRPGDTISFGGHQGDQFRFVTD